MTTDVSIKAVFTEQLVPIVHVLVRNPSDNLGIYKKAQAHMFFVYFFS